jgi:hypothetical protein
MTREKTVDLFILFMNVVAIMVLVGILSVMVNTADAKEPHNAMEAAVATVIQSLD